MDVLETTAATVEETTVATVQYIVEDLTPIIETNTMIIFLLSAILGVLLVGCLLDRWNF